MGGGSPCAREREDPENLLEAKISEEIRVGHSCGAVTFKKRKETFSFENEGGDPHQSQLLCGEQEGGAATSQSGFHLPLA